MEIANCQHIRPGSLKIGKHSPISIDVQVRNKCRAEIGDDRTIEFMCNLGTVYCATSIKIFLPPLALSTLNLAKGKDTRTCETQITGPDSPVGHHTDLCTPPAYPHSSVYSCDNSRETCRYIISLKLRSDLLSLRKNLQCS